MMAEPQSNDGTIAALSALTDRTNDRLRKAIATYMLARTSITLVRRWADRAANEMRFTVSIAGGDTIYPDVHRWLLEQIPPAKRRAVLIKSQHRNSDDMVSPSQGREGRDLKVFYDGSRTQTASINGHPVKVELERPEWSKWRDGDDEPPRWLANAERIVFTAKDLAGREAVIAFLTEIADQQSKRRPRSYIASRWGDWTRRNDMPIRDLDSVVLRAGQKEAIVADLDDFLNGEAAYVRLGIPYHRGYLFHGPPGTGKTSFAQALAAHFNLDVYYLPLPSLEGDADLVRLLTNVEPRSVLLLEDIDVVHGSRVRDDTAKGVTLTGLLNGLDGLITPHGLVTVMTTNEKDVLDPALIRPGRVDRVEELPVLDDDQLARLVATFVGGPVDLPAMGEPTSPAAAVEAIKRHLGDREATLAALRGLAAGPIMARSLS